VRDRISTTVLARGGRGSRANSCGWACTSGSEKGRRHQDKANRPGRRTGRRERERVKSNYQFDFSRIKILSAKVKYIFHLKRKP